MTLYEMLDVTLYYQEVWIYENNIYDQNMPLFRGTVNDARADERVWDYLMTKVNHYECSTGILVIKVQNEHYEELLEKHYCSDKWGTKESERPWKYSVEIDRVLKGRQNV